MRAQTTRRAGACASSLLRFAGRGGIALDQHQALPRSNFAHAATIHRRCRHACACRDPGLTGAAHFDPLAHILDVSPPRAGLRSSWHRRVMLTALPATKTCSAQRAERTRLISPKDLAYDPRASVTGGCGQEVGDRFGVAPLVEAGRHLPEAASSTFGDRVQNQRLAPRFGGDLRAKPDIKIGAHVALRVGGGQGVADRAGLRKEHTAMLLLGIEVDTADGCTGLVVSIGGEYQHRNDQAEREHHDPLAQFRIGVQGPASTTRPAAHRDEEHTEAEHDPEQDYSEDHHGFGTIHQVPPGATRRGAPDERSLQLSLGKPYVQRYADCGSISSRTKELLT